MSSDLETDEKDYEVGYGRPPKSGQFKKGQSGNPRGSNHAARTRKRKNTSTFGDLFAKGMQQAVEVEENGKKVLITRLHVAIRARVNAAAKVDLRALKELLELREAKELGPLQVAQPLILTIEEASAASLPGQDCARMTEEAKERWRKRVAHAPKRATRRMEPVLPHRSAKDLIDSELDRQVPVTNTATGTTERMTMREAIAEQVMRAFMSGKRGASELMIQLNKLSTSPQYLVLRPWEYYDLADEEGRLPSA